MGRRSELYRRCRDNLPDMTLLREQFTVRCNAREKAALGAVPPVSEPDGEEQ